MTCLSHTNTGQQRVWGDGAKVQITPLEHIKANKSQTSYELGLLGWTTAEAKWEGKAVGKNIYINEKGLLLPPAFLEAPVFPSPLVWQA